MLLTFQLISGIITHNNTEELKLCRKIRLKIWTTLR